MNTNESNTTIWADGAPFSTIRVERGQPYTVQYVELTQDTIERLADAIVRRLNKSGEWVEVPDEIFASTYHCSECGESPLCLYDTDYVFSNYCPNCGARMRRQKDERTD